jgi:hypothetical protein
MHEQLSFDDQTLKPEFLSALRSMGRELVSPTEAADMDLTDPGLDPDQERDFDRIDTQGQANVTMTNVAAGIDQVTYHPIFQVRHPKPPTPREQRKAKWYVTGEKQHLPEEAYSQNGDDQDIGIPESYKGHTPWRKTKN